MKTEITQIYAEFKKDDLEIYIDKEQVEIGFSYPLELGTGSNNIIFTKEEFTKIVKEFERLK